MNWIKKIDFTRWVLVNFIVLALWGTVLRYMLGFPLSGVNYLYILHGHSHFAFSGWVFIALSILVIKELSEQDSLIFKWILLFAMVSSFGMLISFSLQGYKAVSISFSSLFLFLTYWFGYLVYRKWRVAKKEIIQGKLIRASIWFLVVSSIGPLALGVLKSTGNTGAIYQNAIYFYLHFQMNGWMLFCVLALIASAFLNINVSVQKQISAWLNVFIVSTIPLFLIFTLWSKPAPWVFWTAFFAALLNALSWFVILLKVKRFKRKLPLLIQLVVWAISLKVILQILVCVPQLGEWTFLNRNLIIGYVHLITLGCVTPVIINGLSEKSLPSLNIIYSMLTVIYLLLLFIQPVLSYMHVTIPHYQSCLLAISLSFCFYGLMYYGHYQPRVP